MASFFGVGVPLGCLWATLGATQIAFGVDALAMSMASFLGALDFWGLPLGGKKGRLCHTPLMHANLDSPRILILTRIRIRARKRILIIILILILNLIRLLIRILIIIVIIIIFLIVILILIVISIIIQESLFFVSPPVIPPRGKRAVYTTHK